jgi:folate-binding Fe-S cluster repair protein YgfZ
MCWSHFPASIVNMGFLFWLATSVMLMTWIIQITSFPTKVNLRIEKSGVVCLRGSLDYEYVPPNEGLLQFETNLASSYPENTPASLRGEAVRSALRSGQCIGWKLDETPLKFGVVGVNGDGCLSFLNNKLTQTFSASGLVDSLGSFYQACLLNGKGRLVDRLSVAITSVDSGYMLTSPGHAGESLFRKLDPYIFPLDQVELIDSTSSSCIFDLVSTNIEDVRTVFNEQILPRIDLKNNNCFQLPSARQCTMIPLQGGVDLSLLIVPSTSVNSCAAVGYTFCFLNDHEKIGTHVWDFLISDGNTKGPVQIGALEFESLRIESGSVGFEREMLANQKDSFLAPPTPLELHLDYTINMEKGCYLGQEGIASVVKNPRGPPRMLYQVVFDDDFNVYDYQSAGDRSIVENLTRVPRAGDKVFVLGSNAEIEVGVLTSVAEPGSTGEPVTVGLALVRRADSIIKKMKAKNLEINRRIEVDTPMEGGSGMIPPPALDPLDGLEVIIGGGSAVGSLRGVPSRRFRNGRNMFDNIPDFVNQLSQEQDGEFLMANRNSDGTRFQPDAPAAKTAFLPTEDGAANLGDDEDDLKTLQKTAAKARKEAAAAADEARRKAEKMDSLQKRAEEAMARRKEKVRVETAAESTNEDEADSEAKRKAEKMELLKKRAEEAVGRRAQKNQGGG